MASGPFAPRAAAPAHEVRRAGTEGDDHRLDRMLLVRQGQRAFDSAPEAHRRCSTPRMDCAPVPALWQYRSAASEAGIAPAHYVGAAGV